MSTISKLRRALLAVSVAAGFTAASVATAEAQSTRWGGVYFGAHLGGAWLVNDDDTNDGSAIGGQVGVQGQWGQWVGGIELSMSRLDLDDDGSKSENLFLASLRLGYAMDRTLIYIKGGYANADVDGSSGRRRTFRGTSSTSSSSTTTTVIPTIISIPSSLLVGGSTFTDPSAGRASRGRRDNREDGWNLGVGIEYAWTQNLVVGVQYDYVNLDGNDNDVDIHKLTARLSYKFN